MIKDTIINLKFFNMEKIKKDSIVVLLGKRNTGKSFLIRDILFHKRSIPLGTVISRTDHLVHYYDKFIPSMLIHKSYDPSITEKVLKRQTLAVNKNWKNPYAFLLLDDCLSEAGSWKRDESIKEIFFNGRHYKLLFILAMQSPMGIPPEFRTNVDFTFILKNNNKSDREKIFKNYAGMFKSLEQFEIILDSCTEDYNCLVVDNVSLSNRLEDCVFFYKAKMHDSFRICSDELWDNNRRYSGSSLMEANTTSSVVSTKRNKYIINKKNQKI